ncbi:hypothetical protein [Arthrobacter sp. NEB 688]|uniref:hypothetical protein n=1 Tax=Arthrobacter sp. NEB 688 TaxID=904039 RepID=UPI0015652D60|nr:hypothetical protein [Arthrobacter sp. NEB 688]QKE83935.1 hypothetical protein HL663_08265 [Arthrobacter sp. NEB 688]
MPELPSEVRDLLARQDGVASRSQLLALGVGVETWRWNAGRTWRVVLPRVVLVSRAEPSPRQRLVAALLWAGPGSVIAGSTAARLHGITSAQDDGTVHLLVPRPGSDRTAGFASLRRTALHDPDVVVRGPLRMSSRARAAVDAAALAPTSDTAVAILVEVVQKGIAPLDDVAEWAHRTRAAAGGQVSTGLAAAAGGAWSRPEHALATLVRSSSLLPEPWLNPRLETAAGVRLVAPDAWFDDVAMAVMVHSHRFHSQGDDWDATVEADATSTAAGIVVVGVTPRSIDRTPEAVLRRLEESYAVAAARPRPPVQATRLDPWVGRVA